MPAISGAVLAAIIGGVVSAGTGIASAVAGGGGGEKEKKRSPEATNLFRKTVNELSSLTPSTAPGMPELPANRPLGQLGSNLTMPRGGLLERANSLQGMLGGNQPPPQFGTIVPGDDDIFNKKKQLGY